jgi:hypothetical protein
MNGRGVFFGVLVLVGAWQAWSQWQLRPTHPEDGVLAAAEPLQTNVDHDEASPIVHGRWKLTPRARYDITARVLGHEDYRFDAMSSLVPEDLALGWGAMSDNRVLKAFNIEQSARFLTWRPLGRPPISREDVIAHSSNNHVIPADPSVGRELARLRVGEVVHLTGFLVDGVRDDGASVRTSLSRTDTGAGACEVMLVETVEVL